MQDQDPTIQDVLTAINTFSTRVEERFDRVDNRLDKVEVRLDNVENRLDKVEGRLNKVENRLTKVEEEVKDLRATMVTQYVSKSYLDQKLSEHTEAIITRIERKFEREKKFKTGVLDILKRSNLASSEEIQSLEQLI